MNINIDKIYSKLRSANIGNYKLLVGCVFFSILLISTFAVMMQSQTVQTILPIGGDSRKQMYFIFAIAIFGCIVFSVYAASLFFKSKSKEVGVMMAMGASKKTLTKLLLKEILLISLMTSIAGLILSLPLAAGIWQLFKTFVANTEEMIFSVDFSAYIWSGAFAGACIVVLFFMSITFLKKSNIIEIVNAQRKNEMIKDIKPWYGWAGLLLMIIGGVGGYMLPELYLRIFSKMPPFWISGIFILVPIGMYLFSVFIVVRSKQGKNKYKNIISKSIMKFQGRQTVRNMCVIAMLLAGTLFATFYVPTVVTGLNDEINNRPYDFEFRHVVSEDLPTKSEIFSLASSENAEIKNYLESRSIVLATDGYFKDIDDDGKITGDYMEEISEENFVSESDFNKIAKRKVNVEKGKFAYIRQEGSNGTAFDYEEEITKFTNPSTMETYETEYQEHISYPSMIDYFIIDDSDYLEYEKGLSDEWKEKMVWFNLKDSKDNYSFASNLRSEIISRSSEKVAVHSHYDRIQKRLAEANNKKYFGDSEPEMQINYAEKDSAKFKNEWKYAPKFKAIDQSEMLINYAVYVLLFVFIALICLVAVLVILYTRGVTIAISNRQVFDDLKHLGGSKNYIKKSVKSMISRVYVVPALIGTILMFGFYMMIMTFNSGVPELSSGEQSAVLIDLVVILITFVILWLSYRKTMKSIYKILNI